MKRSVKIVLGVLAVLVLAAALGVILFLRHIANTDKVFAAEFEQQEQVLENKETLVSEMIEETPQVTPEVTEAIATPTPTLSPEEILEQESDPTFMQKRVNILLLGLDRSTERVKWNSFRTDTMILLTVNFDANNIDMISIPRDSYVKIHNKKTRDKINTAFGTGGGADKNGYEYAMKTVSNLIGNVPINYYVGFDMNVVKEVVDAMGGVDYDVDVKVNMNGRKLEPGQQHMDGQAVLDYARQRKGSSDIARVDRQQRIIMAVFGQMKSTNQIVNIPKIFTAVERNLDTNLSFTQISSLALFAKDISLSDIGRHTVEGEFLNMNGVSYWGISNNKLKKMVKEIFGKSFSPDSGGDVYAVKRELAEKSSQVASLVKKAQGQITKGRSLIASGSLSQSQSSDVSEAIRLLENAIESQDETELSAAINNFSSITSGMSVPSESQNTQPGNPLPTNEQDIPSEDDTPIEDLIPEEAS